MKTFIIIPNSEMPKAVAWLEKLPKKRGRKRFWSADRGQIWIDRREYAFDFIFAHADIIKSAPAFRSSRSATVFVEGGKSDIVVLLKNLRRSLDFHRWDACFHDFVAGLTTESWIVGIYLVGDEERIMFELLKPDGVSVIEK